MTPSPDPPSRPRFVTLSDSENVVVGDHNIQVIGAAGRGRAAPQVSITPRLPLDLRETDRPLRGRGPLVQQLVALLHDPPDEPSETLGVDRAWYSHNSRRVLLLYGPGGCGKTSIAEQVAYEVGDGGIEVWWVDAIDQATVEASMNAVASLVGVSGQDSGGPSSAADVLWRALGSRRSSWLLVIDGADDPSMLSVGGQPLASGTGWIRPLSHGPGLVLVTSRQRAPNQWGHWWDRWPVSGLEPGDGALVLRDYAAEWAGTEADAEALAERRGGMPWP